MKIDYLAIIDLYKGPARDRTQDLWKTDKYYYYTTEPIIRIEFIIWIISKPLFIYQNFENDGPLN